MYNSIRAITQQKKRRRKKVCFLSLLISYQVRAEPCIKTMEMSAPHEQSCIICLSAEKKYAR